MSKYDQAVDKLMKAIQKHDSVREFQAVEEKIRAFPELEYLMDDMKAYQQDAVLYRKIDKLGAEAVAGKRADQLQKDLSALPIVKDYRDKLQDASDLLQYITHYLEAKINEELTHHGNK